MKSVLNYRVRLITALLFIASHGAMAQQGSDGALHAELEKKAQEIAAEEARLLSQIQDGMQAGESAEEVLKPKSALVPEESSGVVVKPVAARRVVDSKEVEGINKELRSQNAAREKLESTLREKDRQIAQLKADLTKTKDRLMLAETEVERLSDILSAKHRSTVSKYVGNTSQSAQGAAMRASSQSAAKDDMPVATVTSDKAYLRTGPGKQNSPLMSISRGTRLVVETREGEWYRVITPAGTRAWISSDLVNFNGGAVRGYSSAQR